MKREGILIYGRNEGRVEEYKSRKVEKIETMEG